MKSEYFEDEEKKLDTYKQLVEEKTKKYLKKHFSQYILMLLFKGDIEKATKKFIPPKKMKQYFEEVQPILKEIKKIQIRFKIQKLSKNENQERKEQKLDPYKKQLDKITKDYVKKKYNQDMLMLLLQGATENVTEFIPPKKKQQYLQLVQPILKEIKKIEIRFQVQELLQNELQDDFSGQILESVLQHNFDPLIQLIPPISKKRVIAQLKQILKVQLQEKNNREQEKYEEKYEIQSIQNYKDQEKVISKLKDLIIKEHKDIIEYILEHPKGISKINIQFPTMKNEKICKYLKQISSEDNYCRDVYISFLIRQLSNFEEYRLIKERIFDFKQINNLNQKLKNKFTRSMKALQVLLQQFNIQSTKIFNFRDQLLTNYYSKTQYKKLIFFHLKINTQSLSFYGKFWYENQKINLLPKYGRKVYEEISQSIKRENIIILNENKEIIGKQQVIQSQKIYKAYKYQPISILFRGKIIKLQCIPCETIEFLLEMMKQKMIKQNWIQMGGEKRIYFVSIRQKCRLTKEQLNMSFQYYKLLKEQSYGLQLQIGILAKILFQQQQVDIEIEQNISLENLTKKIAYQLNCQSISFQLFFEQDDNFVEFNKQNKIIFTENILRRNYINIKVKTIINLNYWGFHENSKLSYQEYMKFSIRQKDIQQSFSFFGKTPAQQNFFKNAMIAEIFQLFKRRFSIQEIMHLLQEKVRLATRSEIWTGLDIFCLSKLAFYYLLYNSEPKLQNQFINLSKDYIPIPIYLRKFNSINNVQNQWIVNEELIWFSCPSFIVLSIGCYKSEYSQGKSKLIDDIFNTNFYYQGKKHPICNCPQIKMQIAGHFSRISVIDIPNIFQYQLAEKLLKIADIILLHCFPDQQPYQSINRIKKQNKSAKIINLHRDNHKESIQKMQKIDLLRQKQFYFQNITQCKSNPISITIFKKKIFQVIQNLLNAKQLTNKFSYLVQRKQFNHIQQASIQIKNNLLKVKRFSKLYQDEMYAKIQKKYEKLQQVQKAIKSQQIHYLLHKLFDIISTDSFFTYSYLNRLRLILKYHQKQLSLKIKKIQKSLTKIQKSNNNQQLWKQIQQQLSYDIFSISQNYEIDQQNKSKSMEKYLQQKVIRNMFTIDIFWRELNYYAEKQGNQSQIYQKLRKLKKYDIINNQPFELLDGDSLRMPKMITTELFQGRNEKTLVISVIGPQSSGKSTLFNFLFGCDYTTSQGRCTRGAYGTIFNFRSKMKGFDSLLLIDTQGLNALMNEQDLSVREQFDSKIVIFAMMISDIVIVNLLKDITKDMINLLQNSSKKFEANKDKDRNPNYILILNHNVQQDMGNNAFDIEKTQFFKKQNTYMLEQAYNTQKVGKDKIPILKQQEQLVIKRPIPLFYKQCLKIQKYIIKISTKIQYRRTAGQIIKHIKTVWQMITIHKNLSICMSQTALNHEKKIQQWTNNEVLKFKQNSQQIIEKEENLALVEKMKNNIMENFQNLFPKDKQQQELKKIIMDQQNKLRNKLNNVLKELQNKIRDKKSLRNVQQIKTLGSFKIKSLQRQIKNQQENKIKITIQEKKVRFQKHFQDYIKQLKDQFQKSANLSYLFTKIKELYSSAIKCQQIFNAGLPDNVYEIDYTLGNKEFILLLKQKILHFLKDKSQNYIMYNQRPAVILLDDGPSDLTKKYFDMKKYFTKTLEKFVILIQYQQFKECFCWNKIKQTYIQNIQQSCKKKIKLLEQIYNILNKYIQNAFNYKMGQFQQFKQLFFQKLFNDHYNNKESVQMKFTKQMTLKKIFFSNKKINIRQVSQHENYDVKRFLKVDDLKQLFQSQKHNQTKSKLFIKMIYWNKIKQELIKDQRINQQIARQINKQIKGLRIYHFDVEKKEIQFEIIPEQYNENIMENNQLLKSFFFIDYNKFSCFKTIKKDSQKILKSEVKVAYFKQHIFITHKDYLSIQEIRNYVQKQHYELSIQLNKIQSFIFKELKKQKTIDLLFQEIENVIQDSIQKYKTISTKFFASCFVNIKKIFIDFNKDLSQLSHTLCQNFKGQMHLFAVYLIVKWQYKKQTEIKFKKIQQLNQEKQKILDQFLHLTSIQKQDQQLGQVKLFINSLEQTIKEQKGNQIKSMINKQIKKFNEKYTRKYIQQSLDQQCFNINSDIGKMMNYIQNPKDCLQQKYQQLIAHYYDTSCKTLLNDIQENLNKPYKKLKQILYDLKKLLQELKLTDLKHYSLFENNLVGKNFLISQNICFYIFLDILLDSTKDCYQSKGIKFQYRKKIDFKANCDDYLKQMLKKQKNLNVQISNFYTFVSLTYQVLKDKIININDEDKLQAKFLFQKGKQIIFCPSKCPACRRICGIGNSTHKHHQCFYGHQIRAFGLFTLDDGKKTASVQRCQDIKNNMQLKFCGKNYTWKSFKQQMYAREDSWKFDDLSQIKEQKTLFITAWKHCGEAFCKKHKIRFVEYNSIQLQQQSKASSKHYIFILDDSGSMTSKWKQLMQTFKQTIQILEQKDETIDISILILGSCTILHQQNVKPSQVKFQITPRHAGTNFQDAFKEIIKLLKKYLQHHTMIIVFMTDGKCKVPNQQLKVIKQMQIDNPGSIHYNGIQFCSDSESMKIIRESLEGTNYVTHDVEGLKKAYRQICERE